MADITDELSRCVITLLLKEPFFAHLFTGVNREVTEQIPTLAVRLRDGHISLLVNEKFFLKSLTSQSQRIAVVKHEVLHLVYRHLFRSTAGKDPELMNLAADLVVNQYIGPWELPEGCILLSTFPDLNLEPRRELEYYYAQLDSLRHEPKGGGNSHSRSSAALEQAYGQPRPGDHEPWKDSREPASGQAQAQAIAAEIELESGVLRAWDRCSPKQRGTVPGVIGQLIEALLEARKPKVDWKRVVKLFATSSRRTKVSPSMKRPSKRYGTYPGLRIRRFQNLAVVVDTSGSVDNDLLALFFGEIRGMWRSGATVTVIEADAAVQRTWVFHGELPKVLGGRGGTDFDAAFQWLKKHRREHFDGCIYLTDGYAPAPTIKPPCKLLWVISPGGNLGNHLKFGRSILMT